MRAIVDVRYRLIEMTERSDTTNIQCSVVNIQLVPAMPVWVCVCLRGLAGAKLHAKPGLWLIQAIVRCASAASHQASGEGSILRGLQIQFRHKAPQEGRDI